MRTRLTLTPLALTLLSLGFANVLLPAQTDEAANNKKVLGYQDAKTGAFHALQIEVPDAAAVAPTTGTLKVVLNIAVKSTFPATSTRNIVCQSDFFVSVLTSSGTATTFDESASRYATGSGTAFTCTLIIPYSWSLPATALQKTLTGLYTVYVTNSTVAAGPAILRTSSSNIVSTTTLPATGSTTTYTLNVTI
jgi:hypothetical protein